MPRRGGLRFSCKLGLGRYRVEAQGSRLPFRPLPRLAQNEELGCTDRETRSGGGLGEMTRRKREIVGLANEQDFPHLVELALPPGGFRSVFQEIDTFHRDRRTTGPTLSSSERSRVRHSRSQSQEPRPASSGTSKSACPTGCSCRTFREEPLARLMSCSSGALI